MCIRDRFQIDAPIDPTNPNGFASPPNAWAAWLISVLSYPLAYLTIVPVALASHGALTNAFATQSRLVVRWTRALEAVLLTGAVTLVSATVFEPMPNHPIARVMLLFLSLIHISEPTRQAEISYAVF